jgi:hypothetical protein
MAKSPSAETKLTKPHCVRLVHTTNRPATPTSGDFFMPQASTASPSGSMQSATPVASLTAVTMGRASESSAPST